MKPSGDRYQVDTSPQFDIKQLYKNLQNNGSLSSKSMAVKSPEPLSNNNRSISNRSIKEIQQQAAQRPTPRAESNILTKEFLRLQIREKEQQLQLKQSSSTHKNFLNGTHKMNSGKYSQTNLTTSELATAMQKYHQYLQSTTQKSKQNIQQEAENQKKNFSYQEKFSNSQSKSNSGLQISKSSNNLLNQFVTKVNQDDMSQNRIQLNPGPLPSKIKKRNLDDKTAVTKPPTPTQKSASEGKFFSARPATSDKQSQSRVQASSMSQSALQSYQKLKNSRQSSDPQLLKKSLSMAQSAMSAKSVSPSIRWNQEQKLDGISNIHGYYLNYMQKAFQKPYSEEYFPRLYRDHFYQTYQGVYFAQFLKPQDPNDLKNKKVYLKKSEIYKNKITLVFDLDETLVHCNENTSIPSDVILKIQISKSDSINAGVNIRPGAVKLLEEMAKHFEIIVFTASHSCYAQKVLDYLDPNNEYIQHRLFRETCSMTTGGMYTKDLRVFADRSLDQLVLIDNAAYSYAWQVDNGIPIAPYYDNKADRELDGLADYLRGMIGCKDVREYNRHHLRLHLLNDANGPQSAFQKVFGYLID